MKRPTGSAGSRPKAAAGLPGAPGAKATRTKKSKQVAAVSRNPNFVAPKGATVTKLSNVRAAKAVATKAQKPKRSSNRTSLFLNRLSPEAKRFASYSRRRRAIILTVVASFGSLFLVVGATMFTPILAVETVRVTGNSRIPVKALTKALADQVGTPLPMVNASSIAEDLKGFQLIESFSVISLPPHTLRVHIVERQPIVIVNVGGTNYLYDPAGVRVGKASGDDKYPSMTIAGDPKSSREFEAAMDVLLALPNAIFLKVASIDAKTKDQVSLRLRGNSAQRIIWGDGSQSVLKSKTLEALFKNQKRSDFVTFDVSSPTAPVVRYGNF